MISQTILKPVLSTGSTLSHSIGDLMDYFSLFWKTFEEQQKNQRKIAELETKLELYEETRRENDRLRKILKFSETLERKVIAARVIGWDLSPWRKSLIIDKGEKHGIVKNMAVIVPEGLVGRVLEAGLTTSRVLVLIDPDSRTSALAAETRSHGLVTGDGSKNLTLRYLDLDSDVQVGETVLSSGVTGLLPKGVRIGKIISLGKDKEGLHLAAEVSPFVAFSRIEEVLCIASSPTK